MAIPSFESHAISEEIWDSSHASQAQLDGNSASDWGSSGSGTTISSVTDTARRSNVIKCDSGAAKRTFYVGDASGTGHNPNDTPWNAAKRTLSFWVRSGELTQVTVYLTSSAGERQLRYKPGQSGTNSVDGSGHVTFFLPSVDTDDWMRFERNIEADYEAQAGGASWTNTDGLGFVFGNAEESHIVYVDDIRLSDSLTVEHNTLGPGVIGHIMRNTTWDATTLARTDRWFHYDQIGTVISTTDADGAAVDMNWFDAFGNTLEDWETGLVASGGGWGLHSKSRDPLAAMHYMSQRWYAADLGVFASTASTLAMFESPFALSEANPVMMFDATGRNPLLIGALLNSAIRVGGKMSEAREKNADCESAKKNYMRWSDSSSLTPGGNPLTTHPSYESQLLGARADYLRACFDLSAGACRASFDAGAAANEFATTAVRGATAHQQAAVSAIRNPPQVATVACPPRKSPVGIELKNSGEF